MAPNSKLNARRKAKREPAKVKAPKRQEKPVETSSSIPLELQQLLLNIFRNSFAERLASDIDPLLQEVKGHLYNRDFSTAFGKSEYLEAYAARWSSSRALGYLDVFWDLREELGLFVDSGEKIDDSQTKERKSCKVVCLGGGAGAEIVALGGLQKLFASASPDDEEAKYGHIEVVATDIADWTTVVQSLAKHVTTAPPLSKYASAAAQAANTALVKPEDIDITFLQHDIFTAYSTDISSRLEDANLITLMFTLNELYSASMSMTQRFLLNLTTAVKPGSLLLVIDSPGSYSSITLNGAEKKYPMQWLLDHTLLRQASGNQRERGKEEDVKWEKVHEDESRWFRLDPALEYPIELENMRMQLHLYRRL